MPARRGFTLIELLVVISIIVVLFAMLFSGIQAIRNRVNRSNAQHMIAEVHNALEAYRGEDMRHKFPLPMPAATPFMPLDPNFVRVTDPTRPDLVNMPTKMLDMLALCGLSWEPKDIDHSSTGSSPYCLLDPWRRPYRYQVDDASAPVAPATPAATLTDWNPDNLRPFAYVWSLGRGSGDENADPLANPGCQVWIYRHHGEVK